MLWLRAYKQTGIFASSLGVHDVGNERDKQKHKKTIE